MSVRVLVAGVSARAIAESAARAGFDVMALDAFADRDQHPAVRALSVSRDFHLAFSATAAARAARTLDCDAVAFASPFENHPRAVEALARGRRLWGNAPSTLRAVRDPVRLATTLRRHGLAAPAVRVGPAARGHWLVKPFASGGGHRVRRWRGGPRLPRGRYLQQFLDGIPGSVVFVAARRRAVPLGMSRQLVGDKRFGAAGFRYCGSVLAPIGDLQFARGARVLQRACAIAGFVAREFDLVGLNAIDFIAGDGVVHPIEVNPRWSASMELVERAFGVGTFAAHAQACVDGVLPRFDLRAAFRRLSRAVGKAVVFADEDLVVGDTSDWLFRGDVRDVPNTGDRIRAGHPICTVFADGRDSTECEGGLVTAAAWIYERTRVWEQRIA
jgi:predicted ATP-grasp superfamily ATP-dependent carboligase